MLCPGLSARIVSVGLILVLALRTIHAADTKPPEIGPEEAREHVGKKVAVTMAVKASKLSKHGKGVFLDSEERFTDEKNLGVAIAESALKKFAAAGIAAPHEHYKGKKIRVVGKIELREDRVYLPLDDPKNIEILSATKPQPKTTTTNRTNKTNGAISTSSARARHE